MLKTWVPPTCEDAMSTPAPNVQMPCIYAHVTNTNRVGLLKDAAFGDIATCDTEIKMNLT